MMIMMMMIMMMIIMMMMIMMMMMMMMLPPPLNLSFRRKIKGIAARKVKRALRRKKAHFLMLKGITSPLIIIVKI